MASLQNPKNAIGYLNIPLVMKPVPHRSSFPVSKPQKFWTLDDEPSLSHPEIELTPSR